MLSIKSNATTVEPEVETLGAIEAPMVNDCFGPLFWLINAVCNWLFG